MDRSKFKKEVSGFIHFNKVKGTDYGQYKTQLEDEFDGLYISEMSDNVAIFNDCPIEYISTIGDKGYVEGIVISEKAKFHNKR